MCHAHFTYGYFEQDRRRLGSAIIESRFCPIVLKTLSIKESRQCLTLNFDLKFFWFCRVRAVSPIPGPPEVRFSGFFAVSLREAKWHFAPQDALSRQGRFYPQTTCFEVVVARMRWNMLAIARTSLRLHNLQDFA